MSQLPCISCVTACLVHEPYIAATHYRVLAGSIWTPATTICNRSSTIHIHSYPPLQWTWHYRGNIWSGLSEHTISFTSLRLSLLHNERIAWSGWCDHDPTAGNVQWSRCMGFGFFPTSRKKNLLASLLACRPPQSQTCAEFIAKQKKPYYC